MIDDVLFLFSSVKERECVCCCVCRLCFLLCLLARSLLVCLLVAIYYDEIKIEHKRKYGACVYYETAALFSVGGTA